MSDVSRCLEALQKAGKILEDECEKVETTKAETMRLTTDKLTSDLEKTLLVCTRVFVDDSTRNN